MPEWPVLRCIDRIWQTLQQRGQTMLLPEGINHGHPYLLIQSIEAGTLLRISSSCLVRPSLVEADIEWPSSSRGLIRRSISSWHRTWNDRRASRFVSAPSLVVRRQACMAPVHRRGSVFLYEHHVLTGHRSDQLGSPRIYTRSRTEPPTHKDVRQYNASTARLSSKVH